MSLKSLAKEIRAISVQKITERAIVNNKEELFDLNTEGQLFSKGIDAQGNDLGEYSEFTKDIKRAKGQPTDRITLRDEEWFHDAWFLKTSEFPFLMGSKDWKAPMLEARFGDIFGLTRENTNEYIEYIREHVQDGFAEAISKAIGKSF